MLYPKSKKQKRFLILLFVCVIVLILSGVALGRYIYSALLGSSVASARDDFYFTSDLLREDTDIPAYDLYHDWQSEGAAAIKIKLRNYENSLNITGGDLSYTLSSTDSSVSGVISAGGKKEEIVSLLVPQPANPNDPLELVVTATSDSPYTKTLRGKFVIHPSLFFETDENAFSPVAKLSIVLSPGEGRSREVVISWPEGAAPDMTNPIVKEAVVEDLEDNTITVTLDTASSNTLLFFKDNAEENYSGITVMGAKNNP